MSSGLGYPDWQKIQQWIGSPLDEAQGAAIGAGAINLGPYNLASWASIVIAIKPTGGKVTVTIKQKLNGGPATLELDEQIVVNNGVTVFEAFVLFGDVVSVTLQGDTVGETVDYAVYPSNTTTNAQVAVNATINFQHNDALVAAEQTIDFEDGNGVAWTLTDDPGNTRVKVAAIVGGAIKTYGLKAGSVSTVGVTFATGADILAAALNFTADGASDYALMLSAYDWRNDTAGDEARIHINLDGADDGVMAGTRASVISNDLKELCSIGVIAAPAAGNHTVNARLRANGGGTALVEGGTNGAGGIAPILVALIQL